MTLPRWTVYPALVVLGSLLLIAVPERRRPDPNAGAAAESFAAHAAAHAFRHAPVVVLGIDGLDPDLLAEVVERHPERMPNFRWLIETKSGIQPLGTSTPPQSPVAWSNFITGLDPGGHGIFDFIHRDPLTRGPIGSTTVAVESDALHLPGPWKIPLGGDAASNRSGRAFWSILADHGVPADVWRMPTNFPVEPSNGVSFPGMLTPAIDSAYGECSLYTTDPTRRDEIYAKWGYEKVFVVTEFDGEVRDRVLGPENPFKDVEGHATTKEAAQLKISVDRENGAAIVDTGVEPLVLKPGQWSAFVPVDFEMMPWWSFGQADMTGICRFYLRSIEPELELYVSPINFDPLAPAVPVSAPDGASADLAKAIGRYYTQGMAEDVTALKYEVLEVGEFMQQVELVYRERREMLDYALDNYLADDEGGLLFFYFSTIDLACHMMWRHHDAAHPHHDAAKAAEDSSAWSGRPGSTWKDTVHDLYLRMDPALGRIRERLGDDVTLFVMSDHGFAPYRRKFNLNTWLLEEGYLVLREGRAKELPRDDRAYKKVNVFDRYFADEDLDADGEPRPGAAPRTVVDWSRTKAYGIGFNGLYLNRKGRELDDPETGEDESGIVSDAEAPALLAEIKGKLERLQDGSHKPVLRCDLATEVYHGARLPEAPDLLVGYNAGYGNSDGASIGRIPHDVLEDNLGGTFNGSHLMAPEVVAGTLLTNKPLREGEHDLTDLTVEILRLYGIDPPEGMRGQPVLE